MIFRGSIKFNSILTFPRLSFGSTLRLVLLVGASNTVIYRTTVALLPATTSRENYPAISRIARIVDFSSSRGYHLNSTQEFHDTAQDAKYQCRFFSW